MLSMHTHFGSMLVGFTLKKGSISELPAHIPAHVVPFTLRTDGPKAASSNVQQP